MSRRLKAEERELMGLRDWAAGTSEEKEPDNMKEGKNIIACNSMQSVQLSAPKPSCLYASLTVLQLQKH